MKLAKSAVGFEHPARGPNHCGQCTHFVAADDACRIVQGTVTAADWCKRFKSKRASRAEKQSAHLNAIGGKY